MDNGESLQQRVRFPRPLAASKKVLVEILAEEETIAEAMEVLNSDPSACSSLAKVLLDAILKMTFDNFYIHADLHSGNIIVRGLGDGRTGTGNEVTLSKD